jgi:hypothetical protein
LTTSCHWPRASFLDDPACPQLEATAAALVGLADVGRRGDELAAARKVGAGDVGQQVGHRRLGVLDGVDGGAGDLAQVVGRDLGGHAHGNARGAVEQHEGQARRQ